MDVEVTQKLIQAILQASDTPLTIPQLEAGYKDLEDSFIPAQKLGYDDTLSLLKASPSLYSIVTQHGQTLVAPVELGETQHVRDLIMGQRKDPSKKVEMDIPAKVEEEILFLLATLVDHRLLVQDLAPFYASAFKRRLPYPKGRLPAWLSTARRFVVTSSPRGRYIEPLNGVDMSRFQMRAQSLQQQQQQHQRGPSFRRSGRPCVNGTKETALYGNYGYARTPAAFNISNFPRGKKHWQIGEPTIQSTTDAVPDVIRQLLQKCLNSGSGGPGSPVFIESLLSAFKLMGGNPAVGIEHLLKYLEQMPECQVIGKNAKGKVCLKPEWRKLAGLLPAADSQITAQISQAEKSCRLEQVVSDDRNKVTDAVERHSVLSRTSSTRRTLNKADDGWGSGEPLIARQGTRGRIKPPKATTRGLSVANRVKLVRFLARNPSTPRSRLIEQLRKIWAESPSISTLDEPDSALSELLQPGGLVISDAQGHCSLRPAKAEGCLGDTSKLSWIPQIWQDALQRSSDEQNAKQINGIGSLPVGFSLRGEVVALEGVGQYWFKPDSVYVDGVSQQIVCGRNPATSVKIGGMYMYAEMVHGIKEKVCCVQVLRGLSYGKYIVRLPELSQLRIVHRLHLFTLCDKSSSDCSTGSLSPISPLFYVKAMGHLPCHRQKITIKVVSALEFGTAMACLDTEECCVLLQVRGVTRKGGAGLCTGDTQPMVVLLIRWAGETLVKLDDAAAAFGIENPNESFLVLTVDDLPWSGNLKEHLQDEGYLPIESSNAGETLSFVRLHEVILLLDARSRAMGGMTVMDELLHEMIFLL